MNRKGQGTIEYLIIIAIIIVIALSVIMIMLNFTEQTQSTQEKTARAGWSTASPWAITNWDQNTDTLTIVLQNNSGNTLYMNSVTTSGTVSTAESKSTVVPGAKTIAYTAKSCTNGDTYSYSTVSIDYNGENINNINQTGINPIVGTCHS
jgi:hypothetical protein